MTSEVEAPFSGKLTRILVAEGETVDVSTPVAEAEEDFAVRFSRGATLFINPTNGFGDDVTPMREDGQAVTDLNSNGPYKSAADEFKI